MNIRQEYNRDGYWILRNAFSFSNPLEWSEESIKKIFDKGMDQYIPFLSAQAKLVEIQRLFWSACVIETIRLLGIEKPLFPSQPVMHIMSPRLRIPDGYYGTSAHQDWPSVQGSLDMITAWIALTDCEDFPLEVIPGSHKQGLQEGTPNGSVLEIKCDDREFIPLKCKAGDVIFLSGFTIHRTGKGNGFRVAVSQRFDNAVEKTFVERGYPCAQKRIVERGIKWRPTVEQVKSIYA